MVGGWAPLIMVWVVNLSSNILRSHSPPHFSVQYRHISPYHPNIVYLPILTGILSVISLCSMIHKWFSWQYPELTQVRNDPLSFVFNVLLLVFVMYYLFSSLSTIIWNCNSNLCTIIAYLSYHVKMQKVCNYSLSMYFTFFWYRTKIVMIYSRWNQSYPNVSYHPWSRQSSWYSPISFHTPPSFIIV